MEVSKLRVTPSEIGGGFGGKTVVFIEPVALLLSRKAGRPVKMVMTREEVFRASGPTSGADMWVKLGATKDGRITAGEAVLKFEAGAFPGASAVEPGANCAFSPYDIENVKVVGFDVVMNRPQVAAYRAPGAPISGYAVESAIDELAKELDIDPIDLRVRNSAKEGTRAAYGPRFGPIGFAESLEAAKAHPHYSAPLGPNQGRGVASGYWFNIGGGETCATLNINIDGTLTLTTATPDIGGTRASVTMMAAEELGIEPERIRPIIGDTSTLGFTFLTGGSRVTFASGLAAVEAARDAIEVLRGRAAKIWGIEVDAVVWDEGCAKPAGANAGEFEPLSLADIAKVSGETGGAIAGHAEIDAQGAGPSIGVHLVDVEVDPETGAVKVVRYTVVQDAGRAIHPSYVEGQYQGGAVQCIGWALNEEYIYGEDGRLENPGFLDYRIPVASDLPMIDTVIVEVPNPKHPYGVRGVGETPIVPGLAAVANAVAGATGVRYAELPMSPPRVLRGIEETGSGGG
jgi:CO/xanthine dehydrogenase Mo-binding subunit